LRNAFAVTGTIKSSSAPIDVVTAGSWGSAFIFMRSYAAAVSTAPRAQVQSEIVITLTIIAPRARRALEHKRGRPGSSVRGLSSHD
jgi:hypothetical protein